MTSESEPNQLHCDLENIFYENLIKVAEAHDVEGNCLTSNVSIRFSYDDKDFNLMPTFKNVDGGVEVTCHPDTIDLWHTVLDEVPDLESKGVEDLYFASVASLVEVSFLAMSAKVERQFEGTKGVTLKALGRAASIVSRFDSKSDLERLAFSLETDHGFVGVSQVVRGLTEVEVFEINRMRYALGTAIFALELDSDTKGAITAAFRRNLKAETENYTKTLLDFLDKFNNPESYAQFESNIEAIKKAAYAQFVLAGTAPMGYGGEN